jgi:hypothetical protein
MHTDRLTIPAPEVHPSLLRRLYDRYALTLAGYVGGILLAGVMAAPACMWLAGY